jgi:hypothetical protein
VTVTRSLAIVVTAVVAMVGLAAAWLGIAEARRTGGGSEVVFPAQTIPLAFSHARHLALPSVQCTTCHPAAVTSRSALDNLIPTEQACRACHAIDRSSSPSPSLSPSPSPTGACRACHPAYTPGGAVARVRIPPPNLKFDHAAHRATDCRTCHGDLRAGGVGLATRDHLPRMATCLGCHDDRTAPAACTTCHLATVGGRVQTQYREGLLAPAGALFGDAHGGDFVTRHGAVGTTMASYCASCHAESFCSDCHQGAVTPLVFHPGNYVLTHAVDARRNAPACDSCHRAQSFCVGCHERSGVGARRSDFVSGDPLRRFHPAGFGAEGGHGREARRNLQSCTSCHREDFCVQCHSAGAVGAGAPRINPHPPGWRGSARCEALAKRNRRMCLRCHIGEDEARCD